MSKQRNMPDGTSGSRDAVTILREDFRHHLETFYAKLQLAPPYHSVEKAIGSLNDALKTLSPDDRALVLEDQTRQWIQYKKAFVESGLHLKHRGIIAGLIKSGRAAELPAEYQAFLDTFLSS